MSEENTHMLKRVYFYLGRTHKNNRIAKCCTMQKKTTPKLYKVLKQIQQNTYEAVEMFSLNWLESQMWVEQI